MNYPSQISPAHRVSPPAEENLFGNVKELSLDALVDQVLFRNPSLAQMAAAWQAASAKYPQVRSWDDPMAAGMIAPASFGSNQVEAGYRVELSQKIYFPGKLALRGEAALAEASAAGHDVDDIRQQLRESARLAFFDYFLVDRALAVNTENLDLLQKQILKAAQDRVKVGAPQQDILQAQVEIGRQRVRLVVLERGRKVAQARINTLLNLPPEMPLPPPPPKMALGPAPAPAAALRDLALAQRPDLKALADRFAADETALALAQKEYLPDVEAIAAYDTMMGNGPMRDLAPQIGLRMNLPIRRARRDAAVTEAQARIAQRRAELAGRINQVNLQVQEAYEQLAESEKVVALYEKTILPVAGQNEKAALDAYIAGKTPFVSLIEARRNLVELRDRYYEATADYFRRRATLERVVGGPMPTTLVPGLPTLKNAP